MSKKTIKTHLETLTLRELRALWSQRWTPLVAGLTLLLQALLIAAIAISDQPRYAFASLEDFFYIAFGSSIILTLLLAMRSFSEDYAQGTWLQINLSSLSSLHITTSKIFAIVLSTFLVQLVAASFPLLLVQKGHLSTAHLLTGYFGLVLVQCATTAIGTFFSSLTARQLLSLALSSTLLIALLALWMLSAILSPELASIATTLSFYEGNFHGFMAGRLVLSEVTYYVSISTLFIAATTLHLRSRRLL